MQEEWLDYIAPQVYWSFDFSAAQYNKVTDWWIEQTQGKNVHLYIGHAAYKVGDDKDPAWNNPDEIPNQIKYNTERFNQVKGSVFFSYKDLKSNRLGIRDRLIQDLYRYPALIPAMPWIETMNRTLQLTDWQWKQLYDNMGEAWNAGKFTDWGWMVKIENHTLTVDEFAWLNNHILTNTL